MKQNCCDHELQFNNVCKFQKQFRTDFLFMFQMNLVWKRNTTFCNFLKAMHECRRVCEIALQILYGPQCQLECLAYKAEQLSTVKFATATQTRVTLFYICCYTQPSDKCGGDGCKHVKSRNARTTLRTTAVF